MTTIVLTQAIDSEGELEGDITIFDNIDACTSSWQFSYHATPHMVTARPYRNCGGSDFWEYSHNGVVVGKAWRDTVHTGTIHL